MPSSRRVLRVALVDDYDVVLAGVARMFDQYPQHVVVTELDATTPVVDDVDIALYDSFAQPEADQDEIRALVDNPHARKVVVYTWNFDERLVTAALDKGASGYLSKTLTAAELVEALQAIHRGEQVISPPPPRNRLSVGLDWPGRSEGLSERESRSWP